MGPVTKLQEDIFWNCTSLETVSMGSGIKKIAKETFDYCTALKVINVPAKKVDYYKKRLPEELHSLIVELPAEKKAKKKLSHSISPESVNNHSRRIVLSMHRAAGVPKFQTILPSHNF